jgi:hypothetical protein
MVVLTTASVVQWSEFPEVGGVSKIEKINYAHESRGTQI